MTKQRIRAALRAMDRETDDMVDAAHRLPEQEMIDEMVDALVFMAASASPPDASFCQESAA